MNPLDSPMPLADRTQRAVASIIKGVCGNLYGIWASGTLGNKSSLNLKPCYIMGIAGGQGHEDALEETGGRPNAEGVEEARLLCAASRAAGAGPEGDREAARKEAIQGHHERHHGSPSTVRGRAPSNISYFFPPCNQDRLVK